ncbi:MAG: hypothetical protein ABIG70_12845 [Pseudomonadota bacterium]
MSDQDQYNTFQINVNDNSFTFKGSTYRFDEIAKLALYRVRTTQTLNYIVKVGEPESATLFIALYTGKEISLSFDESGFFLGFNHDKKVDINNVIDLYNYLSEKTFSSRLQPYLNQVNDKGYFDFPHGDPKNQCRFYPGDKIIFRDKEYPIRNSRFESRYGCIEIHKKNSGLFGKIVENVMNEVSPQNTPLIMTLADTDVIFFLLEKFFGSIKWR